ncbi:hypothetical protein RhiirA5_387388 [Rhizophagus irregularis]|uniref:Uncharacterized protein n=1 Tax=Rhizophagus irregularis TaxID=588596 RepID=A0A2I1EFQ3_9GLOM|nr:hypothetical protein RhiirA5_387388 [Rhizophagus irregularis]PKY20937.1 hypothetical protein RhiirB3_385288 [Rhizophagus irregularis]
MTSFGAILFCFKGVLVEASALITPGSSSTESESESESAPNLQLIIIPTITSSVKGGVSGVEMFADWSTGVCVSGVFIFFLSIFFEALPFLYIVLKFRTFHIRSALPSFKYPPPSPSFVAQ